MSPESVRGFGRKTCAKSRIYSMLAPADHYSGSRSALLGRLLVIVKVLPSPPVIAPNPGECLSLRSQLANSWFAAPSIPGTLSDTSSRASSVSAACTQKPIPDCLFTGTTTKSISVSLALRMAVDDGAIVLADLDAHDPLVTLSSREHGNCVVLRALLGVEGRLVDDALPSIPNNGVGHHAAMPSGKARVASRLAHAAKAIASAPSD